MDWRHKAVCRDEDPELFFPVGNSGPALAQVAAAKKVCNRCPVVAAPVSASNPLTPSSSFYSSYSSTQLQLASKIPGISAQLLPPSKVDSC